MARFTVELNDIVNSGLKVFNFDYVFYDNTKKPEFEQLFIDHFLFREIGQETVGRFQHYLKVKFRERLPYYNELLKLTLLEYDVLKPYSITETLTKTNSNTKEVTGNATQNGTLNRDSDVSTNGNKTNTLDSTTNHSDTVDFSKTDTQTDNGTVDIDNKKVESNTPNGLLAMEDIKTNVYASQADIENNSTKTTSEKTDTSTEKTTQTTVDDVNATSYDTTNDTSSEDTTETTTNTANTTQNETENATEDYTLTRKGHIGVQTASDLLQRHVELLGKIQTVYTQFFDECEDLFMQVY
jgi:hypothetical protein